jgi:uncharacterized FlaG/YvyC family protein
MKLQEKYEKVRKAAEELHTVMKTSNEYVIFEYWNRLGEVLRQTEPKEDIGD